MRAFQALRALRKVRIAAASNPNNLTPTGSAHSIHCRLYRRGSAHFCGRQSERQPRVGAGLGAFRISRDLCSPWRRPALHCSAPSAFWPCGACWHPEFRNGAHGLRPGGLPRIRGDVQPRLCSRQPGPSDCRTHGHPLRRGSRGVPGCRRCGETQPRQIWQTATRRPLDGRLLSFRPGRPRDRRIPFRQLLPPGRWGASGSGRGECRYAASSISGSSPA